MAKEKRCYYDIVAKHWICEGEEVGTLSVDKLVDDATEEAQAEVSKIYAPYEHVVPKGGPNGESCVATAYREVPEGVDPKVVSALSDRLFNNIRTNYPDCPVQPGDPSPPETAQSFARRYWVETAPPPPEPYIAPGRAITGMFAYLETRGNTTYTFTEANTPFGPLTIVATGKYYVDWGDGTKTGPHSAEGEPWPDGKIKHEYIHIGNYDVVVTERWAATWSFGDQSGTLDELRTVGRIEDFPVQQIQAVVLR